MLKHYIHCHESYNLNKGGSVGYLSTLYASFERYGDFTSPSGIQNCFLFPNLAEGERLYPRALDRILYDDFGYINEYQNPNGMQVLINERKRWFREVLPTSEYGKIDFNNIKSIHMHGAYNFLPVFNTLHQQGLANQVVKILTTHNPHKPEFEDMELISRGRTWADADIQTLRYFYQQRDYWAFKLSDAFMFPSEYSMEGYFETWPEFERLIKNKKVYFCTTSGQKKIKNIDGTIIRQSLGIPQDATVLLYLGRFVNIRGYDILIEAAKQVIAKNPNVYFLVVGESVRTTEFKTNQWLQIPFTTTPGNYIDMADACLCPNRGSLFDLSMIEILASGTPLLGCEVGGYKWLQGKTSGALLSKPNDVNGFVQNILDFLSVPAQEKARMRKQNRKLYEDQLHLKYFYQNYLEVVEKIYDDFGIKDQANQVTRLNVGFESNYKRNEDHPVFFATSVQSAMSTKSAPTPKPMPAPTPKPMPAPTPSFNEQKSTSKRADSMEGVLKVITSVLPDIPNGENLSKTQRNIRKLKKNPKLFISDVAKKRVGSILDKLK